MQNCEIRDDVCVSPGVLVAPALLVACDCDVFNDGGGHVIGGDAGGGRTELETSQ